MINGLGLILDPAMCAPLTLPAHYLQQNNAPSKYNFVDMIATFELFIISLESAPGPPVSTYP